jgi:cobalamin-dependent methionine synthase I
MLSSDLALLYSVLVRALVQAVRRNESRFPAHSPNKEWPCSPAFYGARAVQVNIAIMRTFVHVRALLATHEDLRRKIEQMETRYDAKFSAVFATLKQMLEVPVPRKKEIGFHAKSGMQKYPH